MLSEDNVKIQDWNYEATKMAIRRAVAGLPSAKEVIEQALTAHHPLAPHDYKQEKVNKPREAA